jgi:hypothetical protein
MMRLCHRSDCPLGVFLWICFPARELVVSSVIEEKQNPIRTWRVEQDLGMPLMEEDSGAHRRDHSSGLSRHYRVRTDPVIFDVNIRSTFPLGIRAKVEPKFIYASSGRIYGYS